MSEWTCIAYLPDGSLCGQPATVLDSGRQGMICERCARAERQLDEDQATHAFSRAKRAVEASPLLREYVGVILSDWTRDDSFWDWIATAKEDEIEAWARASIADWSRKPVSGIATGREEEFAVWAMRTLAVYENVLALKDARIRNLEARVAELMTNKASRH